MKDKKDRKQGNQDSFVLRDYRRKRWFWSYDDVFDIPISAYAKLVYLNLSRRADADGISNPSQLRIAEDCSISVTSVKNALIELTDPKVNMVKFISGKEEGKPNEYVLLDRSKWKVKAKGGRRVATTPGRRVATTPGRRVATTKEYINNKDDNSNNHHHQNIGTYMEQDKRQDDDGFNTILLPKDSCFGGDWLTQFLSRFKEQERIKVKRLAERFDYLILTKGKPKWMKNETGSFVKLAAGEMNIRLPEDAPTFEERLEEERRIEQRRVEEEKESERQRLKAEEEERKRKAIEEEAKETILRLNEDELERFIQEAKKRYELKFLTDRAVIETATFRILDGGGNWRDRLKELLIE